MSRTPLSRRGLLQSTTAMALVASLGAPRRAAASSSLGPLVTDPQGVLDLPAGFSWSEVDHFGTPMSDGFRVPGLPDGMGCFVDGDGRYVLLRNHEMNDQTAFAPWQEGQTPPPEAGATPSLGGVTRVVLDPKSLAVLESNLVLSGTMNNCGGGIMPTGWVSCEETDQAGHGWAYFCPIDARRIQPRSPLTSWGRFRREAICFDPGTGIATMTEDHSEACVYRHVPTTPEAPFEGRLEALAIAGRPGVATRENLPIGEPLPITWVPVEDPSASQLPTREQARARGAALFYRTEGITQMGDGVAIVSSLGGPIYGGQIFFLDPIAETLTLLVQVEDRKRLSMPDNALTAPWGDILVCEDNYDIGEGVSHQHIRAVTSSGTCYDVARNAGTTSEFAGGCFSPDGRVLFVNLQKDHRTLAITGGWPTN